MNRYPLGQLVTVSGDFTDSAGDEKDPTAIWLHVVNPGGNTVTYQYGVGSEITRLSTGSYSSDLSPSAKGLWVYKWQSSGTYQAAGVEQEFYIE